MTDVDVAISRTQPAFGDDAGGSMRVEALYMAGDRRRQTDALHREPVFRLAQARRGDGRPPARPDGPEIVIVNPEEADGWLEEGGDGILPRAAPPADPQGGCPQQVASIHR